MGGLWKQLGQAFSFGGCRHLDQFSHEDGFYPVGDAVSLHCVQMPDLVALFPSVLVKDMDEERHVCTGVAEFIA